MHWSSPCPYQKTNPPPLPIGWLEVVATTRLHLWPSWWSIWFHNMAMSYRIFLLVAYELREFLFLRHCVSCPLTTSCVCTTRLCLETVRNWSRQFTLTTVQCPSDTSLCPDVLCWPCLLSHFTRFPLAIVYKTNVETIPLSPKAQLICVVFPWGTPRCSIPYRSGKLWHPSVVPVPLAWLPSTTLDDSSTCPDGAQSFDPQSASVSSVAIHP